MAAAAATADVPDLDPSTSSSSRHSNGGGGGPLPSPSESAASGISASESGEVPERPGGSSSSSQSPLPPPSTSTSASTTAMLRLFVCTSGICAFYLAYGLLQERLFSSGKMGPTFCLLTACVTNSFVALVWKTWRTTRHRQRHKGNNKTTEKDEKKEHSSSDDGEGDDGGGGGGNILDHRMLLLTSLCYVLSMTCSNEAVPIVGYPIAVLAKSCKLVPTVVCGSLFSSTSASSRNNKPKYSANQWVASIVITAGILIFQYTRVYGGDQPEHSYQQSGDGGGGSGEKKKATSTAFGMALLWTSLLLDGLLGTCQDRLKEAPGGTPAISAKANGNGHHGGIRRRKIRPPTASETMLYTNVYAVLYLVPLAYFQNQIHLDLLRENAAGVVAINAAAAFGQIFVFLCLAWFSPIVTTTITTTRKFFTILISVWTYGHRFSTVQWTSVAIVFAGLYLAIAEQRHQQQQRQTTTRKPKVD